VIERRLIDFMMERYESPTVEHVLSGPGVHLLYEFIVHEGLAPATAQFEIDAAEDPSAVVGRLGVRDLDPASSAAVGLFVDILGSELGNIALSTVPRGGLYIWGGVALKLRSALEQGHLVDAFLDKAPMTELLRTIPVALLNEPSLGLYGALAAALTVLPA
jgi:glucokinase